MKLLNFILSIYIVLLLTSCNFEEGGEASIYLNDLYMEVFKRLFQVLRTEDPEKTFDEVRDLLEPVSQIWIAHAENAKKASPDASVPVPGQDDE